MNQDNEYGVFGRQVGFALAANIGILILGIIRVPILTKGLGPSLFGSFTLIFVTVSLIVPFTTLGFTMSIIRFLSAEKDREKLRQNIYSAMVIVLVTSLLFSLILFFLSDIIAANIIKDTAMTPYIKLGCILIVVNSLHNVLLAVFRMQRKIGQHTSLTLNQYVLQVGLMEGALLLGYGLGGVITALIISNAINTAISAILIFRQFGICLPRFSDMKSYLRWGIPLTPNSAILWIINTSDRYMVSYFLDAASTGIYSAAYNIGHYASFPLMPVGTVLYPTVSKTYDTGDIDETRNYLRYSLRYLMMIAIPAACGLSIMAEPMMKILTTKDFTDGTIVIPWVAGGVVLNCFYQTCVYIIHLVGKTHITVRLLATSAVTNIVLNLVLIPRMGIVGAAIATLAAFAVLGGLTLFVTRRYMKFDLSLPFIGKSIIASAVMTLCVWWINPQSIPAVIISVIAGVVIYFGMLLVLRALSRQEIDFFRGFVRDNIRKLLFRK